MPVARCQPTAAARLAWSVPKAAGGAGSAKAERTRLRAGRMAAILIDAVDRNHAADRLGSPQRGLRAAHDLDARGEVGVQKLEAGDVPGRRVVDADAVDEQQGVVGFRTANADFGERAGRALGRDRGGWRQPEQGGDERLAKPLDALGVDDGDARGRLASASGAREAVMTIWSVSMGSAGMCILLLTNLSSQRDRRSLRRRAHAPRLVPAEETDDGPRQVPDFAGRSGVHSCGHSAGFSPASL